MTELPETYETRSLIRKRAASKFVTYLAVALVLGYMIATSSIATWNAVVSNDTRGTIVSCVTTGGKCNKENQEKTAELIQRIFENSAANHKETRHYSILAAGCAADPKVPSMPIAERIDFIDACVQDQLRREKDNAGQAGND
jgi:hypothetical protein